VIAFGQHLPCPNCGGSGELPLNDQEKNARAKELRMAKKRMEEPPPIVHSQCAVCHGAGFVKEKGKYR
jgi:DnaJ-class molecular chaperone